MRIKIFVLFLTVCVFLSACALPMQTEKGFYLNSFGESFSAGNTLFCVTEDAVCAYSQSGQALWEEAKNMADARWNVSGSFAVIYDCGGNGIITIDGKTAKHNYINNIIMSTEINKHGYTAVCTEEAGYKGSVTVYDAAFTPIYKWYCASGYVINAALSEENTLTVLTANAEGSTAHVFKLTSEEEQYSVTIPSTIATDLCFMDETLCLISETALYFADEDKITDTISFEGTLGEYALTEEYAFTELQNGDGTSRLYTYDGSGKCTGSAECEMLRSVVAESGYIAVISGGEAIVFDKTLREKLRCDAAGIRGVMLCGGSLLLQRDSEIIVKKFN